MAIIASNKGGDGQTFQPAPAGVHQAVCVDVIDLGVLDVTWQGVSKKQHKVNIAWQISENREDGKPFLVFKRYTLSLHERSSLRKDLESWLSHKLTREEELGFDVESLLGKNCLLNIVHKSNGDRTYANAENVSPLMKGMVPMVVRDYTRKVDRPAQTPAPAPAPADEYDSDRLADEPEWVRD